MLGIEGGRLRMRLLGSGEESSSWYGISPLRKIPFLLGVEGVRLSFCLLETRPRHWCLRPLLDPTEDPSRSELGRA